MIITKMSLPRRTLLRGMGATLALPFLDAMTPALCAKATTAAATKHRLGFVYAPNGMILPMFTPKDDGKGRIVEVSPILGPLAAFRDRMTVVTGLSNSQADDPTVGSAPHTRCGSVWLNGVHPKRTEGADIQAGTTIDQYCAKKLGEDTQLLSLEIALDNNYAVGNCDQGYSCTYVNTFSWRTPTTPMPMETNPRQVFERLFGDGGSISARLGQLRRDRSVLDWVAAGITRLQKSLGSADRATVSGYLEAIRDVERRIVKAEQQNATSPAPPMGQPLGIPETFDEHAKVMLDLQVLAYQADITRVVTFQLNRERTSQSFPWIGVPENGHDISHHGNKPETVEKFAKINTYHSSLVAYLVEKMANTPDGDGSLLDHSMLLFGSGMGDGSIHSPHDLPLVLVGGGCGQLKGGRHLKYPSKTPMMNLLLSIGDKVGVELESIGDSTGRLTDL